MPHSVQNIYFSTNECVSKISNSNYEEFSYKITWHIKLLQETSKKLDSF